MDEELETTYCTTFGGLVALFCAGLLIGLSIGALLL